MQNSAISRVPVTIARTVAAAIMYVVIANVVNWLVAVVYQLFLAFTSWLPHAATEWIAQLICAGFGAATAVYVINAWPSGYSRRVVLVAGAFFWALGIYAVHYAGRVPSDVILIALSAIVGLTITWFAMFRPAAIRT